MSTNKDELHSMSADELWSLYLKITAILPERLADQKQELEKRLLLINRGAEQAGMPKELRMLKDARPRRKYKPVLPKYSNPATSEVWSGRGKLPRWMKVAMESGHGIEEFRIDGQANPHLSGNGTGSEGPGDEAAGMAFISASHSGRE